MNPGLISLSWQFIILVSSLGSGIFGRICVIRSPEIRTSALRHVTDYHTRVGESRRREAMLQPIELTPTVL